jgi:hypothetical protein
MLTSNIGCYVPLRLFASFWCDETVTDLSSNSEGDAELEADVKLEVIGCSPLLASFEHELDELEPRFLSPLVDCSVSR